MRSKKSIHNRPPHIHEWVVVGPYLSGHQIICKCKGGVLFGEGTRPCDDFGAIHDANSDEWEEAMAMQPGEFYPWKNIYWRVIVFSTSHKGPELNSIMVTANKGN